MTIHPTPIDGLILLEPRVFGDDRGYFFESLRRDLLPAGMPDFVQHNESMSKRGVLRGLHFQAPPREQGKLVSVVRDHVVPWRYPPTMDFLYGEWLRRDYLAGMVPGREVSPDVATLLTIVRAAGRAIAGPPPAELLDRVPPDDLRRAVVAGLPALRDELADDTRNVLLTLARAWVTLATGETFSPGFREAVDVVSVQQALIDSWTGRGWQPVRDLAKDGDPR